MLVIIMKFSLFTLPSLVFGLFMSPGHGRRLRVILRVNHTKAIAAVLRALFVSQPHPASVLREPAPASLGKAPALVPEAGAGSSRLHP